MVLLLILEHFHHPRRDLFLISSHSPLLPSSRPWRLGILSQWICLLWTSPIKRITEYLFLYERLLSLSIMFSSFIHAVSVLHSFYGWIIFSLHAYTKLCLSIRQFLKIVLFAYWLGLRCCAGFSLVVVSGLLIALASLVAEHRLQGGQALVAVAWGLTISSSRVLEHGLSSCGEWT